MTRRRARAHHLHLRRARRGRLVHGREGRDARDRRGRVRLGRRARPAAASRRCSTSRPGCSSPRPGTVHVFGEPLAGINRRAGYMFQTEALMPWRTALDNVIAGPASSAAWRATRRGAGRGLARARRASRASATATRTSCPAACASASSLAQMLILDPQILLMDEPFSALDIQTRQLMENELLELWSAEPQERDLHHPRPRGGDLALRPRRRAVGRARRRTRSASSRSTCRGRATWPRSASRRASSSCTTSIWHVDEGGSAEGLRADEEPGGA